MMDLYTQFDPLLSAIAAIANNQPAARQEVEDNLQRLEKQGWRLSQPVHQVWAGERDLKKLCEGLDEQDTLLVKRLLELMDQPGLQTQNPTSSERDSLEKMIAGLPPELIDALQTQNEQAFWQAVEELAPEQQEQITRQLELLQAQAEAAWLQMASQPLGLREAQPGQQPVELPELMGSLPIKVRIAILDQDAGALQAALAEMPLEEADPILAKLIESGLLQQAVNAEMMRALADLEPFLQAVAGVANGNQLARPQAEAFLEGVIQDTLNLPGLREAVLLLWDGERRQDILTVGLDEFSALVVQRLLTLVA
jgi:hypothetical protein